jgi:hypothetical protein
MTISNERFTPTQMQQLEDQLIQADDVRLYRRTLALLMWVLPLFVGSGRLPNGVVYCRPNLSEKGLTRWSPSH